MLHKLFTLLLSAILFTITSCSEPSQPTATTTMPSALTIEQEKTAILAVINDETKAAFSRDYEGWQNKWVHAAYVTKTYINIPDSSSTETLGWEAINHFVKTYIDAHPKPDPIPTLVDNIDVRLYGTGAWVSYEQNDAERGRKRETRLMEKLNGTWKIAGMHTTIYGFD